MTQKKRPAPANGEPSACLDSSTILAEQQVKDKLTLVIHKDEPRIDSRVLALHFGKDHHDVFELVKNYLTDFEELGIVRFQTEKPRPGSKAALLALTQATMIGRVEA